MERLKHQYNDGGRASYFKAQSVGDCVVRAAAIASGRDYKEVYNLARQITGESPRDGMHRRHIDRLMSSLGAYWHPTMKIGSGCHVHLRPNEIPMNKRIVCNLSRHVTAVIDGVINDTYDPQRDGNRCVYGFWIFPNNK